MTQKSGNPSALYRLITICSLLILGALACFITTTKTLNAGPHSLLMNTSTVSMENTGTESADSWNLSAQFIPQELIQLILGLTGTIFILLIIQFIRSCNRNRERSRRQEEMNSRAVLLLNSTTVAIYGVDADGICTFCNTSCLNLLGFSCQEDLLGKNIHQLIHHTGADNQPCSVEQCLICSAAASSGITHSDDAFFWRADHTSFPCEFWAHPVQHDGMDTCVQVTFLDITKQKQKKQELHQYRHRLEQKIRESEVAEDAVLKLSLAVEQSPVSIIITDPQGSIEYVNKKFRQVSGYSSEEAIGQNPRFLKGTALPEISYREFWEAITSGKTWSGEFSNRDKYGRDFQVRSHVSPVFDAGGKITHFISLAEDITHLKKVEEDLQASRYKFKKIIAATSEGFWFINNNAETTDVNPAMCEILGLDTEQILGKTIYDFVDRKNQIIFEQQLEKCKHGESTAYEIALSRPDGSQIPCIFNASPYLDEQGSQQGSFALVSDISAQKTAMDNLTKAKNEAVLANQSTSRFLSSMNHELRTPLNAILGFSELLSQNPDNHLSQQQVEQAEKITGAGEHLLKLINGMLDLARIEAGTMPLLPERVDPGQVITEVILELKPLAANKQLKIQRSDRQLSGFQLECDRSRLKQILLNLVSNAIKYSASGTSIVLEQMVNTDKTISITVQDYGRGISAENLKVIFKPFQRAGFESSNIQGTGTGLTIAQRLTEMMGGSLSVESQPEQGSCFTIRLPGHEITDTILPEPLPTAKDPVATASDAVSSVLYIEDNPSNVMLMEHILASKESLNLTIATTGKEGLALAANIRPAIILTDITLPDMDGFEVLKNLKKTRETEDIPVIALSGNALPDDIRKGLEQGFIAYLPKPLNIGALYQLLSDTLKRELT